MKYKTKILFLLTLLFVVLYNILYTKAQSDFGIVLGEMKTSYAFKGEKVDRASNIELAASKVNGVILQPQQIFSYNDTVGNRTIKNGFKEAHVIINGDLVDGIGGGVCQVSGTLHAAMFFSGLEIIEATQHSRKSTYIDAGLDATVSWGSKDLKMQNIFPFPVKIVVDIFRDKKREYLTIKIMGKQKYYTVEHETIIHYQSKVKTRRIKNPQLKHGQYKLIEKGTPAMDITRIRRRFNYNESILEEKRIHYQMSLRILEINP